MSILSHIIQINEKRNKVLILICDSKYKREKEFKQIQVNNLTKKFHLDDNNDNSIDADTDTLPVSKNEILNYVNELINHNNEFKYDEELKEFINDEECLEEVQKHFKKPKKQRIEKITTSNKELKVNQIERNKNFNNEIYLKDVRQEIKIKEKTNEVIAIVQKEEKRHYSLIPIEDSLDPDRIGGNKNMTPRAGRNSLILSAFLAIDEEDKK